MTETQAAEYRVLARKYRPQSFADLIGQEAMVRTLTNAIRLGRLAHAFILTGVRGVGKTTTARIIARALNCTGPGNEDGPTVAPCGVCDNCVAIAADRHLDVIEMDAASRTGVDDIRELIDGVPYRPVMGRYKIYIVDEVHMLSKSAFNALLKTLEEPPAHVKFVFATTEIGRVPVTVLSRCQRFDLRRVDAARLADHLTGIAVKEEVELAPGAAALIARAADGSVRDGLSLLDQAFAQGDGAVTEAEIRDMIGLADRTQVFDLFDRIMAGDIKAALELFANQYDAGADPLAVLEELLGLVHWLTRLKLDPAVAERPDIPEAETARGRDMAARLAMPVLARAWQMLLKGLGETRLAPAPLQAAEMILVRLAYAAELPSPAEIVAGLDRAGRGGPASAPVSANPVSANPVSGAEPISAGAPAPDSQPGPLPGGGGSRAALASAPQVVAAVEIESAQSPGLDQSPGLVPPPSSFEEVVALVSDHRETLLHGHLYNRVHLVRFEPGHIELRTQSDVGRELPGRLGALLGEWTGQRWLVTVSDADGAATLAERDEAQAAAAEAEIAAQPLVRKALETFPGAKIAAVRAAEALGESTPPPDGEAPGGEQDDTNGGETNP